MSADEVDDFTRAEQGACLLVAMGLPVVSVLAAVVEHRDTLRPQTLWEAVA